ncbi:glucose-6-phosphate isomerase [Rhodothermus bifroesti]|uniref:Glucose-6-phosphate isomerase n=1 Tax=Rhodothermus marinus TaxID=29549 RepID=A0A7V2B246_RHOMR|nr:glucose-6-phosphate isomerase [Rhodothermus bifroesti]GBD02489.1 Glucose-6-phosphate isomerase B [bacterium HR18]
MLRYDYAPALAFLEPHDWEAIHPRLEAAQKMLLEHTGPGHEMLGWRELLRKPDDALLEMLDATAAEIREQADVFLCLGIGGSYLGARAVIEALTPSFRHLAPTPEILFAGHHLSGSYLKALLNYLEGKSVYLNVVSKSGTTLETMLAFRVLRPWMEARFPDASRRILVTTDPAHGRLLEMARTYGYPRFAIPPNVGGRFSVLTAVGLLPIAVAGVDIRSLFYGAVETCERLSNPLDNPALNYAALRYLLYERGYALELLAVFEPRLSGIGAWWQQLFGESEGKQGKGLYPDTVQYSTDLHSLGQYVQEGRRHLIETFLMVEREPDPLLVPDTGDDLDGLAYLSGRSFQEINRIAYEGTRKAHAEGGVPVSTIWLEHLSPNALGACLYFFMHAVAISGYLLGVNPFDQPGVEAYKREMYRLLGHA